MRRWIKICGVQTIEAARAITEAGADLVGLNFVPTSKRCVDLVRARDLIRALGDVVPVGVFRDQEVELVEKTAGALHLPYVQLHGSESAETCARLAGSFRVIKAVSVIEPFDPASLRIYEPYVEAFLLDGPSAGSGTPFDWSELDVSTVRRPFLLAGGLDPDNVANAIALVRPNGVDTASGVETRGTQDVDKIRTFVEKAKRALEGLSP
jgi:phosphoribosylanthranilate isomerase